ncbi:MAG: TauD/TfdA family dioxygenase [Pseudomonadota bacterium]
MHLQTRPLHEDFGLELMGLDIRALDDSTLEAIEQAWISTPVLLIRDQLLNEAEQVAFSQHFGATNLHVREDIRSPSHPEVVLISNLRYESGANIGALASGEAAWHMDSCYKDNPDTGCFLYAVEVPPGQGRTSWSNLQLAYESLSASTRDAIEGCRGEFAYQIYAVDSDTEAGLSGIRKRTPDVTHPMVLTQPGTQRKGLYLDPLQTFGIDGMSPEQSAPILDELKSAATNPEYVWEHTWERGDLVLWDNARVLHRREPFDDSVPRLMKRTTVFLPCEKYPTPQSQ